MSVIRYMSRRIAEHRAYRARKAHAVLGARIQNHILGVEYFGTFTQYWTAVVTYNRDI